MAWGSGGPEDAAIEAEIEAAVEAEAAEADAMDAMAEAEMAEEAEMNAAVGGIASGRNFAGDPVGRVAGTGLGGGASRPGPGFDFADDAYAGGGLLDGYDYNDDMLDTVSSTGLLDNFYDEDEDYQGQMMDAYTKDFEGDYDARNFGQKFGDWFNKNNPIINALRSLGIDANLDQSLDINDDDRDDSADIYRCEQAGGTWNGGTCVMPSDGNGDDGNGDDDGGGDVDYGAFGKPNPFASLTRKRQMWYHPMLGGTGHGQVYDPYSGERPSHVDANLWDYMAPRGGAELPNWATALRKWGSGE